MNARFSASMPNRKQNNPEIDIDEQIDRLVSDMTEATQQLEKEIELANVADETFETDALISSAVQSKEAVDNETEPAPPTLDEQVEEMLEDAAASVESAPESKSTVDAVDEELAELADEMLDGDFDDADTVLAAGIEAPKAPPRDPDERVAPPPAPEPVAAEPEHVEDIAADDLVDGDFDDAEELIAQGEPAAPKSKPAPKAEPVATPPAPPAEPEAPAPQPEPEPEPEPEADAPSESEPKPARAARHKKRKVRVKRETEGMPRWRVIAEDARDRAGEAVYMVAEKLTKPLDSRPEMLKGLTGWLAAVTLFNAAAVWVFLLIARGPAPGSSDEPAVDLVGQQTSVKTDANAID